MLISFNLLIIIIYFSVVLVILISFDLFTVIFLLVLIDVLYDNSNSKYQPLSIAIC